MDIEIKMPDLATTDDAVTLLRWLVDVGQPVKLGQPLFEIETDKATMEVESVAGGVLAQVSAAPGDRVAVGQVVALIRGAGSPAASAPAPAAAAPSNAPVSAPATASAPAAPVAPRPAGGMFARNRAARTVSQELPPTIRLTSTQIVAARRLTEAKSSIPHFYLSRSANAEAMVAYRKAHPILWDIFFVYAAARAAAAFPRLHYRFDGDKLTRIPGSAVGVAVDVDGDLFVVPVEDPLSASLEDLSASLTARVERLRRGDAGARQLGSTYMTISNLGSTGIESFTAVLNPPESAILAVGRVAPAVVPVDGQAVVQQRVALTLSADHRVISGKYAAAFLDRLVSELENIR